MTNPVDSIKMEPQYRHNWLYSVVPVFGVSSPLVLLAGYCKVCDQAFSKQIPWDMDPTYVPITKMGIPKWGCVDATMP